MRRLNKAERERREREFAEAQARTAKHEALWVAIPESPEKDALKAAMLDEAWRLLDHGQTDACDAILDCLPRPDVTAMLDEYFRDDESIPQEASPTLSKSAA